MNSTSPILNIKMTPAGVELVLAALRKLPYETVEPLIRELYGQYQYELSLLTAAGESPSASATEAPTDSEA